MSGLFSKPKAPPPPQIIEAPKAPVVDQSVIDRQQADTLARRRGRAATVMAGSSGAVESGSLAKKSLLGM